MTRTPWFNALTQKPPRLGYYEARRWGDENVMRLYYNGRGVWLADLGGDAGMCYVVGFGQINGDAGDQWRGLAEQPRVKGLK